MSSLSTIATTMTTTIPQHAPQTPTTPGTKDIDQLVATLRNDPSLHVFLSDDFSPQAHVGAAVLAQRVQPALQDAQRASTVLSASVRQHVIRRKEALLAEVEAVDALEREVASVSTGVTTLVKATGELSNALDTPHTPMREAVNRATNIAKAAALVRALQRFRFCSDRLRDAGLLSTASTNTVVRNLPMAAEAARELEQLLGTHETHHDQNDHHHHHHHHRHHHHHYQHQHQHQHHDHQNQTMLEKVDGVARDAVAVRKATVEVRKRAATLLRTALTERNQTDVEAAVMAFHSLGVLHERVSGEISRLTRETQAAVHRGFEAPSLSTSKSTSLSTGSAITSTKFEKDVWDGIEQMLTFISDACFKALLLQHVLSRKYCPTTHMSLLYDCLASSFIDSVARTIIEQISIMCRTRVQRAGTARVFLVLAEGYPRLRSLLKDVSNRICMVARALPIPITKLAQNNPKLPIIPDAEFIERAFLNSVVQVETQYLTASHDQLSKAVNSLFEGGKRHPGEADALNLTKLLAIELDAARSDRQLRRIAIGNVAKAIRLYTSQAQDVAAASVADIADKKSNMSNMGHDHSSGTNSNGSSHLSNLSGWALATVYNGMVALSTSGARVLAGTAFDDDDNDGNNDDDDDDSNNFNKMYDATGQQIATPINKELNTLSHLSDLLLDAPFSSCRDGVRAALARMHTEDMSDSAIGSGSDDGCSVYVLDVSSQLSMLAENVLPSLARSRCLGTYTLNLAKWALDTFVAHAALVPMSSAKQQDSVIARLSTDLARMELAVDSLCPARLLSVSFHRLRALRACILIPTDQFIADENQNENGHNIDTQISALPTHTIAHVLLARTADPLLVPPYQRQQKTPAQYVEWLEKHTDQEAWLDVEESLNLYTMRKDEGKPNAIEFDAIMSLASKVNRKQM